MTRLTALAGVLAMAGCAAPSDPPGQTSFMQYCAACHGADARGGGPLADDLQMRPAVLTRLSADNGGRFPYGRVMAKVHGYPGQYQTMPEFGTLLAGPTVIWTDEEGRKVATPQALMDMANYLATLQEG